MKDSFAPVPAVLEEVQPLIADHRQFSFRPEIPMVVAPGQFVEISIPGVGAFPVSVCDLVADGRIISCVRRTGRVTDALFRLAIGSHVGLRGPFGHGFPLELFTERDALLVAGGLGMAPLRALLMALLKDPERSAKLTVLYGAREPQSLLFRDELTLLSQQQRIEARFSVDFVSVLPGPAGGILCQVGLVNELLADLDFVPEKTVAAVCGPPAMYRSVLSELSTLGIPKRQIWATLERRMRCGVGECCHCVTAGRYICQDGPVFSLEQLQTMPGAI